MDNYQKTNGIFLQRNDIVVPTGKILIRMQNVRTGKITEGLVDNMIVTAGKNSMANGLFDSTKGMITYCALGTSAVAPALTDTGLLAEVARKQISVRTVSGKVATFSTFFTTAEAIGSLREAGLYGDDASSSGGTGTLFARAAINRTKTVNDTLSLAWSVTIG